MSNTENGLTALLSSFEAMQKKFMDEAQTAFKAELVKFFDLYPEINVLTWRQYTPYWNDGETCEFSVHDVSFGFVVDKEGLEEISPWGEFEGHEENGWLGSYDITRDMRNFNPDIDVARAMVVNKACKELGSLISSGKMEDVMRAMFGDHVYIIATREGLEINELSHD